MTSRTTVKAPVKTTTGPPTDVDTHERAETLAQLFPAPGEWTESDYLALTDQNRIIELSNGKPEIHDVPTDTHQKIVLRGVQTLLLILNQHPLGEVRFAPLPIRLWPRKFREPDIVFMAAKHADRIREQYRGVPDLVVEVLSLRTRNLGRVTKMWEYAQAGIQEYWIVDPQEKVIEVYTLEDDRYLLLGRFGQGDTARSKLLSSFEVTVQEVLA